MVLRVCLWRAFRPLIERGGGSPHHLKPDSAPVRVSLPEHAEKALTPAEKDGIAIAALGRPRFRGGDWNDYLEHTGRGAAGRDLRWPRKARVPARSYRSCPPKTVGRNGRTERRP